MTFARHAVPAAFVALAAVAAPIAIPSAHAASAAKIAAEGEASLRHLEAREPRARFYARHARAVLVFPSIFKAGLVFGGEGGNGVLLIDGRPAGFYNIVGGTAGLQIGAEKFSYALFFMNDGALRYLQKSAGFALGTGPSVAVINKGAAASADTTTIAKDVYALPYREKGLMADLTLQGTKISPIHPN